jgi:hypothetical protein
MSVQSLQSGVARIERPRAETVPPSAELHDDLVERWPKPVARAVAVALAASVWALIILAGFYLI